MIDAENVLLVMEHSQDLGMEEKNILLQILGDGEPSSLFDDDDLLGEPHTYFILFYFIILIYFVLIFCFDLFHHILHHFILRNILFYVMKLDQVFIKSDGKN